MRHKIVAVAGIAALALAGCGSETGTPVAAGPATSASASSGAITPATAAATPPPAGNDGELTPTGTTLAVGQAATVQYETKDLSKETTKLSVTAVSAKKGAISDLSNFQLDAQTKTSEPYYVTMTFRNAGPNIMEPGGIFGLIKAHNTDGEEMGRISLIGSFKKCDGDTPKTLAVGASYTDCGVYLAPPGQNIGDVELGFYLESNRTEITWKVG
ncbi:MAG: hypothetical protein ACJ72N_10675 [Labedaea sp.]